MLREDAEALKQDVEPLDRVLARLGKLAALFLDFIKKSDLPDGGAPIRRQAHRAGQEFCTAGAD
jgi:hypothetical protein